MHEVAITTDLTVSGRVQLVIEYSMQTYNYCQIKPKVCSSWCLKQFFKVNV